MKRRLNLTLAACVANLMLGGALQAQFAKVTPAASPSATPMMSADTGDGSGGDNAASATMKRSRAERQAMKAKRAAKLAAREAARNGPAGQNVLERLTAQLTLTDEQKAKIAPILQAARAQIDALREDKTQTVEQKLPKIKEVMETARTQINAVLTPAQQRQMLALKKELKGKGGKKGASKLAPASPAPSVAAMPSVSGT